MTVAGKWVSIAGGAALLLAVLGAATSPHRADAHHAFAT
jgi:hypothetical protein